MLTKDDSSPVRAAASRLAGKWHLGYTKEALPASQGFEKSFILAEGGADNL